MSEEPFDYEAIRDAIAKSSGGAMVTNYALVAQVISKDGSTSIQTITDCDHAWQVLGMFHHALLVAERDKYRDDEGAV